MKELSYATNAERDAQLMCLAREISADQTIDQLMRKYVAGTIPGIEVVPHMIRCTKAKGFSLSTDLHMRLFSHLDSLYLDKVHFPDSAGEE